MRCTRMISVLTNCPENFDHYTENFLECLEKNRTNSRKPRQISWTLKSFIYLAIVTTTFARTNTGFLRGARKIYLPRCLVGGFSQTLFEHRRHTVSWNKGRLPHDVMESRVKGQSKATRRERARRSRQIKPRGGTESGGGGQGKKRERRKRRQVENNTRTS